ncbi:UbiH/UbiF family hydroxylase [Octadecabacter sp. G9-8]|uniref:UbiH/UbiF family hydroxylase n=1 Tax=Octadecabacter dasysiphoniae TaxID=2909341 RepID=A0ABS9D032_9RHOB|nr:UbiH/UbiF family hydroxylase [Octadecabacter dasysiphoniae]MCF2871964.1 UbiH/UbiF family hydroxylase [Octadecabacter dasysiphoniae]
MTQTDIFISGGGVAGLTAAAAFGTAGFSVIIADPMPPITDSATDGADLRTTAFLQPARDFLDTAGLWDKLGPHATPLQIMRIVDAGGPDATPRMTRDFDAADISDLPFGWNLPNWVLRREMVARLAELPNVDFRPGVGFASMLTRTSQARVTLTDGSRITAKLVIGADGRNSPVRHATGIDAKTTRYGQKAVTFAVTHDAPHDSVSTEIHRTGGPFTLVPLPDHDGKPCSAVVWMEDGAEAVRLAALPPEDFNAAATTRSANTYGPLTLSNRRMVWPIISQIADRMAGERVALVAEAAHVVPPIGAQGLNMSLADLSCLLDLAQARPDTLGDADMLARYHTTRHRDITVRVKGVDLLNRASQAENPLLRDLRAKGVEALYGLAPVRKTLMRLGLGAKG